MYKKARIKYIAYYLPEKVLSNDDLSAEFPEWSAEKIITKTGIGERHIAAPDEFTSDMAVKAAQKLFDEYGVSKSDIDYILLCTQSPDYQLPTTACIVQDRLGISATAGALDFNLGCSGYVYGLSLAKGLIAANIAKNILLITSETYSKYIHEKDRGNRTIFGDAAAATLISDEGDGLEIEEFVLGTDGRGADNLIVKNSGSKYKTELSRESAADFDGERNDNYLYMDGSEIFNFTIESVPGLVNQTLEKNKLSFDNVDLFVFHQANKYMLNHLRKKIGIAEEKFLYHIENCGNTVSSTIPIVLKEAFVQNKIQKNMQILLAGFGVGYSWGGVILKS
ncbi:3-oxoacyl-ACP synthase III family protein [Mucilaginibacter ginsenosidivorans]|uniref:Ketoacyl-ACP synthase III n=1 Tax=Mucilaginibacter ginsenosidivorans TaxID=398053 RepID=A0A5B8V1Z6_9SPHI|nr:ketoacyl-ACP synthase III [Mucilaginibacter ginsenosidivorans]QEC65075.1 ketoacyl-ACP synthase III [Mucilaginibacter ginsenosidivorans]